MKKKLLYLIRMVSRNVLYGLLIQCVMMSTLMAHEIKAQIKPIDQAVVRLARLESQLPEIFRDIEARTDYRFVYPAEIMEEKIQISLKSKKQTVNDILVEVGTAARLRFKQVDNTIYVAKPEDASDDGRVEISIDMVEITGRVTDEKGEPIPGATVIVEGTSLGTVTNIDGGFTLDAQEGAVLLISFIGYQSQRVTLGSQTSLNIVLREDLSSLQEVVVVGYGTQEKAKLTGSVASVKADDIDFIPTSNLSNLLAGRAPGVQIVQSSGFAGAPSSISIRGSAAIAGSSPLYVIDNVIRSRVDFDALDPNEVESISFLKDAATAAIYGARAANGVVLVTTRQGTTGKPVFNYKSFFTTSRPTMPLPRYTATQELEYINSVAETFGNPLPISEEIFRYFEDKNYELNDYIWRNPSSQQHNLSVNGGTESITYYMMLGTNSDKGSFTNTDYSRYNFRSNVTARITKDLRVNLNLSGNKRVTNRFFWPYDWDGGEGFELSDFYRTTFNWSRLYPFFVDADGNPTSNRDTGFPIGRGAWNPVLMLENGNYRKIDRNSFNGIIKIDYDLPFLDGLTTSVMANYSFDSRNQKNFVIHNRSYLFQQGSATNPYVPGPIDPSKLNIHNLSRSFEGIDESATFGDSYQFNWFLDYNRSFGDHSISGTFIYEQAEFQGKTFSGSADQLLTSSVDQIFAASTDTQRRYFTGSESQFGRASWIGRTRYEFSAKYIAEFSFRYDGSHRFPKETRWGFFPSGSVAWRITEENFLDIPALSELKFRASIGTTGDDNVAPFQFQNNFVPSAGYVFGNTLYNGIRAGTPPNPTITWAKMVAYNFGFDFGLFNDKLVGSFDYFHNHRYDLLRRRIRVIPGTYGAPLSDENYAEIDVKGAEFSLNYRNSVGRVNYTIGANIGYAKDKVLVIDEPVGLEDWRTAIGHPINRIWGYRSRGIIRDQATLEALPEGFMQFGREPMLGVILYEDIRGVNRTEGSDGIVDENDQDWLSDNAIPRINYGINGGFSWRNLKVDFLLQGVGAFDKIVKTQNTSTGGVFQTGDRPYFDLWTNRWTPNRTDAPYPRAGGWGMPEFGWGPSDFWIRSGAYLRLKNLNIAYDIPSRFLTANNINLQFFFNGTNLFVLSAFTEYDPEQDRLDSYPLMKSYTGGINVRF
ncbi:TonB-dependent receptor [Lunatimonas lonarensis]|uniref:TonB-dependent receptor n=1 Tax=Lunatimonas lonarensis TaxID=1232681 RepID=R7ZVC7_9BACT|nr:TonB-dependent receptor [Lunatimonas lonarensis]EON77969.1 TonB-dependent receptor [Lunatimonas lonarensis]